MTGGCYTGFDLYASVRDGATREFSLAQARRVALAAQGFAEQRPDAPSVRDVRRVAARLGLLQIDSVNVLVRAHYMPLFSRLGTYDTDLQRARRHGALNSWSAVRLRLM